MISRPKSFLLVALLLFAPWSATAAESGLVRLSFPSGWDALPAIVGIERGFFAEQGLVVSGMAVSSGEAALKSVALGSSDVVVTPQRTLMTAIASKLPVKVVAMAGWGTQMDLMVPANDKTTKSIADLKGKTVAMVNASEAYPVLIRLMNKAKLPTSAIKIKTMKASQIADAFKNKQADAIFESRHLTEALLLSKRARPVMTADDVVKEIGYVGALPLLANANFVRKEPATVQKFVNGWVKALKYIQQDPDDAAGLLQLFFHRQGIVVSKAAALSWVKITRYDRYAWSDADVADAEYNGWGLKEGKILKSAPKLAGYIDNSFANKAVR